MVTINQENKDETGILQAFPVLPILFLIYISGVFERVETEVSRIVSLLFVDNLGFIAFGISVKQIAKALEKVSKLVLEWGAKSAVTYNTARTELVFIFSSLATTHESAVSRDHSDSWRRRGEVAGCDKAQRLLPYRRVSDFVDQIPSRTRRITQFWFTVPQP